MTSPYNHGRHWYFLAVGGDPQTKLRAIFAEMAAGGALAVEQDGIYQMIEAAGDLRCSFMMRGEEFIAGYPLVVDGYGWPLRIHDVLPWPDGVQAHIVATCEGSRICLFDSQHFLHKHNYADGHEHVFVVAGLAYRLFDTVYENEDQEFELTGTKGFFPVRGDEGGCIDEIKFMSHVETVREVDFHGITLRAYTVTLAEVEEFPLRLDVFAHPSVCEREFQPGDAISGFVWLFGAARGS